jgi:hypothetical protein
MPASVRAATGTGSNAANQTISETAASPQAGDVRYTFVNTDPGVTITGPTGWTSMINATVGTGKLAVFRKTWVAGEGTATVTFSAATNYTLQVVSVANADLTATPQSGSNGGTGTTLTANSLTAALANELQLVFFGFTSQVDRTLSTPTGMTVVDSRSTITIAGEVGLVVTRTLSAAGATGNAVSTASSSANWRAAMVLIPASTVVAPLHHGSFLTFFGGGS